MQHTWANTLLISTALATTAYAQNYPAKPLRIIVQYGPGSTIDIIARIISPKLHEGLGQPVIVENRAGAGGAIGMDAAAKAAPDGYTLTIGATGPLVINPLLYAKSPFDPVRDFAAVSQIATGPAVIAVHRSIPAKTVKELVALAKARPGQLNYGSPGVGTSPHLAGELFQMVSGTRMVHVPYKGNAEAITDLIGGHLSIVYTGVPPVASLVKAGKVRLLATTGATRLKGMPDLPTIAEAGLPGAEVAIWYGAIVPSATPREIIGRLNSEIVRIGALQDVRERFSQQGIESKTGTAEAFSALVRDELVKWGKVIKAAKVKVE
ncbi:MAG TPA: tripartite tricarboxylate transporter substrate binding protein [Burkholderiales bacterium]|nr:tripartite tricarboxylate transporter substrate binding protein [Burkholderiales bacterium]